MIEDYSHYDLSLKEYIKYITQGTVITIIVGRLFYQSVIGMLLVSPMIYFYCKNKKSGLIKKRKWQLNLEFRDGILSIAAALHAGYSVEHAIEEALKDLTLLYDKKAMIVCEFTYIVNRIRMNITVEKALYDFGQRTGIEDIISFAEVFSTAKRTGGDLISVIRTSSNAISDKIEVKREIITLIAAKKQETDIMKLIPLGIIGYLTIGSPEFLAPLYHNIIGVVVMTTLLGIYMGTYILINKITAIEI